MSEDVKRMADLLKSGATMLSDVCPECGNPLFRVKGDIFCAKCNKPVVYARATGPQATVSPSLLLETVEQTIVGKISETNALLKLEKDLKKCQYTATWSSAGSQCSKSFETLETPIENHNSSRFSGFSKRPLSRSVNSTIRRLRLARTTAAPACFANSKSSLFLSFPRKDLPALHSTNTERPFRKQTNAIGFD